MMKNKILLVVLLLTSLFCAGLAYGQARPQFEYKYETAPNEKRTNALANEGWELVAIESAGASRITPTYIFKRVKP